MDVNNAMNLPAQPSTLGQKLKKPFVAVKEAARTAIDAIDRYTSPREGTKGDFEKGTYFQASFQGAQEGFALMGLPGIIEGAIPSGIGVAVTNATGKWYAGLAAGVATGAALGCGIAMVLGNPVVTGAIGGALLGSMETFRGDSCSATRDAGGNANMISAPFIKGPGKIAAGIGSALGTKVKSKTGKAIVGGVTAAAIGGVLAAIGFSPVSVPVAIAACAAGGVLGPFLGPRYSQFFRNLSQDIGTVAVKGLQKLGIMDKDQDGGRLKNVAGAIPSSFLKESVRGLALSDGNIGKMLISGVCESLEQAHIFLKQKKSGKEEAPPPAATQGGEGQPPKTDQ
jgi:hypothetical protein